MNRAVSQLKRTGLLLSFYSRLLPTESWLKRREYVSQINCY